MPVGTRRSRRADCGAGRDRRLLRPRAPDAADGRITVWGLEHGATRDVAACFTRAIGIRAELVPIDENELPARMASAAAAGDPPDVLSLPRS